MGDTLLFIDAPWVNIELHIVKTDICLISNTVISPDMKKRERKIGETTSNNLTPHGRLTFFMKDNFLMNKHKTDSLLRKTRY